MRRVFQPFPKYEKLGGWTAILFWNMHNWLKEKVNEVCSFFIIKKNF